MHFLLSRSMAALPLLAVAAALTATAPRTAHAGPAGLTFVPCTYNGGPAQTTATMQEQAALVGRWVNRSAAQLPGLITGLKAYYAQATLGELQDVRLTGLVTVSQNRTQFLALGSQGMWQVCRDGAVKNGWVPAGHAV